MIFVSFFSDCHKTINTKYSHSSFNIAGEKGGKEGLKRESRGDDDETASVTSYESSMVSIQRKSL